MINLFNSFRREKKFVANRRRHPRIPFRNLMRCFSPKWKQGEYLTNLVNLSESGMQYLSTFMLQPDTKIDIVMSTGAEGGQIPAQGRVVWVDTLSGSESCRAGVEFVEMSFEDQELIRSKTREYTGLGRSFRRHARV